MELTEQHQRTGTRSQSLTDDAAPNAARAQPGSLSILALIEPFFAQKKLIICCVLASMLLGWLALLVWPRKYQSEARLLIRVGRESVSLDPTATTSETMMLQKTQEEEINSVLEMMGSRFVAEKTVEQLGPIPIIDGYLPGDDREATFVERLRDRIKDAASEGLYLILVTAGIKDELSDRELAIMKLQKNVGIYARKKSSVVVVNSESRSPEMAQALSQAVIDSYLKEHLRTGRTEGSQLFFETQAGTAESQLNKLLDRRTAMLHDRDIESIESKRAALLSTLSDLDTTVRRRLNELELKEVEMGAKLTKRHPDYTRLRRELKQTRSAVQAMQVDLDKSDDAVVRRTALLLDRTSSDGNSDSTAVRLLDQKRQTRKELGALMDFQLELDDVERSIGVVQDRLDKLRSKQEEARLIDELQSKQISNIRIAQPPTFEERPSSPNKKLLVAGFTALGFLVGFGLVITREMGSKTFRSVHQMNDLRNDVLVVDMPSRRGTFKRFNAKKGGRWKTPVMKQQFEQLLQEVLSMRQWSREGVVVGVTGLDKNVGTTTIAAALAVYADSEGIDTLLVTDGTSSWNQSDSESNGQHQSLAEPNHSISERVRYLNVGSLKQLDADDHVGFNPHEYREEMGRWMRSENDLTIVDLPRQTTRNASVDMQMLDCVVVVMEAEKSTSADLTRCLQRLETGGVPVTAVVLNKSRRSIPRFIEHLIS